MRRQLIFVVLMLVSLLVASVGVVHAADATVGTGTSGSCTEAAFDTALATVSVGAGGTITFNCGGAATITFSSQKILNATNATYIIDGNNEIILDGGNSTRLFRVENGRNASLTLRNITLQNGRAVNYPNTGDDASQGGAILFGYGNDTLRIENSQFLNNVAVTNGGQWDGGGAIHIRIAQMFISDSLFQGNSAPNGGAMNILITSGSITNTIFRQNSAYQTPPNSNGFGGAIYIDNGMLTMTGLLVENNTSYNSGAGYSNCGGSANIGHETIINSTFRNNVITGTGSGAGVYNCDDGISISGTTINNNISPNHAGGFWHHSNSNPGSTAAVVNSTISNNTSGVAAGDSSTGNGAGVTSNGPAPMYITNSTIVGNTTGVQGSAIRAGDGPVTITDSIIANNSSAHQWVNTQCHGTIINGGGNVQWPAVNQDGRDATCSPVFTTADPRLGVLQDNGGPTETHELLAGSAALDIGSCGVPTDQRGIARPAGTGCDSGAYEAGDELPSLSAPENLAVNPNQGRPTITWTDDNTADWFELWVGTVSPLYTLHTTWYPRDAGSLVEGQAPVDCNGTICTLSPNIDPFAGTYYVYMRAYDLDGLGFSKGGVVQGWSEATFTLPNTPAGTITNFQVGTNNPSALTFTWTGATNTTWYGVWIGQIDPVVVMHHFNWYPAADIGCATPGETCTIQPNMTLTSGDYGWYVYGWGPGGHNPNAPYDGWFDPGTFTVP